MPYSLCCLLPNTTRYTTTIQVPLLLLHPYQIYSFLLPPWPCHLSKPPMLSTQGLHWLCHFTCSLFIPIDRLLFTQWSGQEGLCNASFSFWDWNEQQRNNPCVLMLLDDGVMKWDTKMAQQKHFLGGSGATSQQPRMTQCNQFQTWLCTFIWQQLLHYAWYRSNRVRLAVTLHTQTIKRQSSPILLVF